MAGLVPAIRVLARILSIGRRSAFFRSLLVERLELLHPWVEPQDRLRTPVADPDHIGLVDVDVVRPWPLAPQVPACPTLTPAVIAEEIAAVPTSDPCPPPVKPSSDVLSVSRQEGTRRQYVDANALLMG